MPIELKNIFNSSGSHSASSAPKKPSQIVSTGATAMVWSVSGIVLASCTGGGTGGVTDLFRNPDSPPPPPSFGFGPSHAKGGPLKNAVLYFDGNDNQRVDAVDMMFDPANPKANSNFDINGNPRYVTGDDGMAHNTPGGEFIADISNAIDVQSRATFSPGDLLRSLPGGGIATPITTLIVQDSRNPHVIVEELFANSPIPITLADILNPANYDTDEAEVIEDSTMSGYDSGRHKKYLIERVALGLEEFRATEALKPSPRKWDEIPATEKINTVNPLVTADPNDDGALGSTVDTQEAAARASAGGKPVAAPALHILINEDTGASGAGFTLQELAAHNGLSGNLDGVKYLFFADEKNNTPATFESRGAIAFNVTSLSNFTVLFDTDGDPTTDNPLTADQLAFGARKPVGGEAGYYYVSASLLDKLTLKIDANYNGPIELQYQVDDGEEWTGTATLQITVDPVDDAPAGIAASGSRLTFPDPAITTMSKIVIANGEDASSGIKIADITITDADDDGMNSALQLTGANAGRFQFRDNTSGKVTSRDENDDGTIELWLIPASQLDIETLDVTVQIADNPDRTNDIDVEVEIVRGYLTLVQPDTTEVGSGGAALVPENFNGKTGTGNAMVPGGTGNGVSLGRLKDLFGNSTFTFTAGTNDNSDFQIGSNGELYYTGTNSGNYEADDILTVQIMGTGGNTPFAYTYVINLSNVNEHVPIIDNPTGTQARLVEGTIASGTDTGLNYSATDPDGGDITWKIYTSAALATEDTRFMIDANGNLLFAADIPVVHSTTPTISLWIVAEDSGEGSGSSPGNSSALPVTLTVSPAGGGGGGPGPTVPIPVPIVPTTGSMSVAENTPVATPAYTVPARTGVTYTLDTSGDHNSFDFDTASGELRFKQSPDFEAKQTYTVTLKAAVSQNNSTVDQVVTITVTPVDEGAAGSINNTIGLTAALTSGDMSTPVGQIYTATVTADPDNMGTDTSYIYVWKTGATTVRTMTTTDLTDTFTVMSSHYDAGALTVEVSYTDLGKTSGNPVTVTQSAGSIPAEPNTLATGAVSISSPTGGLTADDLIAKTVTIDTSGITDADTVTGGQHAGFTHKVYYSATDPGTIDAGDFAAVPTDGGQFTVTGTGTTSTFTFSPDAVNKHIFVETTFKDSKGNDETVYTDLGKHMQEARDSVPNTQANAIDLADLVNAQGQFTSTLDSGTDVDWYRFDIPAGTSASTTNLTFAGRSFDAGTGFRFEVYAAETYTGLGAQAPAANSTAPGKINSNERAYFARDLLTDNPDNNAVTTTDSFGTPFAPGGFDRKNVSVTEGTYYLAIYSVGDEGQTSGGTGGDYIIDLDIA
jgi:hypothetical protein